MPSDGFKSITVSESVYNTFQNKFNELKSKACLPDGVTTLSGYFNYKLKRHIVDKNNLELLARKIEKIPYEFLESSLLLKKEIPVLSDY